MLNKNTLFAAINIASLLVGLSLFYFLPEGVGPVTRLIVGVATLALSGTVSYFVLRNFSEDKLKRKIKENIDLLSADDYKKLVAKPVIKTLPTGLALKRLGGYFYAVNEPALKANPHLYVVEVSSLFHDKSYDVSFNCIRGAENFQAMGKSLNSKDRLGLGINVANVAFILRSYTKFTEEIRNALYIRSVLTQRNDSYEMRDDELKFAGKMIAALNKGLSVQDLHNLYFHPDEFHENTSNRELEGIPFAYVKAFYGLPEESYWSFNSVS